MHGLPNLKARRNVLFALSRLCTIRDNADQITDTAKSGTTVSV